jgi:hypothetical protein
MAGSTPQVLLAILGFAVIAEHDHDGLELIISQAFEYLDAASAGHANIQDYDVGRRLTDLSQPFRSAGGLADNFCSRYLRQA